MKQELKQKVEAINKLEEQLRVLYERRQQNKESENNFLACKADFNFCQIQTRNNYIAYIDRNILKQAFGKAEIKFNNLISLKEKELESLLK
jgi:hypothetical protein